MGFADWLCSFINPEGKTLGEPIRAIIDQARLFGLPERDVSNALDMLEYAEYECAFDIIVQQLYEYDVSISAEYFRLLDIVAKRMRLAERSYFFVKELIR
jgi:hypothetical protein